MLFGTVLVAGHDVRGACWQSNGANAALAGEMKDECATLCAVAVRAYTVSFKGVSGVHHSVQLEAETVYEAAIRGIHLLRRDGCVDSVGPGTELEIQLREPATTHRFSSATPALV